ncbi:lipocalin-like domain-containing protein [Clostridium sp. ZS2-4]|uniref:lipocalin-like domain-containing protein n=1 Tax=Clostridium sp. ZS2-4 TaxID=2987703 RepID=UPI00227C10CB|nr:lipocalin-like domain-containing protein [Clostridium sp. ZS2-4]MCY6354807.1 hypothetical protein [Clostridium sp. ZS2-4]
MAAFFRTGDFEFCKGHYLIFSILDLKENSHQSFSFTDSKLLYNMILQLPVYLLLYPGDKKMREQLISLLRGKIPSPHQMMRNTAIASNPTQLLYGESSLSFIDESENKFHVHVVGNNDVIDLQFCSNKPITLVGKDGKPNQLFYYSFTQNNVEGFIKKGKVRECVRGKGWFDHQWGYLNSLITRLCFKKMLIFHIN